MTHGIRHSRIAGQMVPELLENDEINGLWQIRQGKDDVIVGWLDSFDEVRVERFGSIADAREFVKTIR